MARGRVGRSNRIIYIQAMCRRLEELKESEKFLENAIIRLRNNSGETANIFQEIFGKSQDELTREELKRYRWLEGMQRRYRKENKNEA